jgi:hypothetical protein
MSTDSAGLHPDPREGESAWRNPVANQAFDGFKPHTKVVSDSSGLCTRDFATEILRIRQGFHGAILGRRT